MSKILLSGYFGFDNIGDEAILNSLISRLKKEKNNEVVVLSSNPEKTSKKYNVKSVNRMNIRQVLSEIIKCDILISGGGSLFQDVTSNKSFYYYLYIVKLAKLFKKKVVIYSQGIGPVNNEKNRLNLSKVFNKVDIINVRDDDSKCELISMGVDKDIHVTADSVFLVDNIDKTIGNEILRDIGITFDKKIIGISIRKWKSFDSNIKLQISKFIDRFSDEVDLVFLPFHHPDDLDFSNEIYKEFQGRKNVYLINKELDETQMLSVINNIDIIVSMRLHGLILGIVGEAYPVAISYDPKIDSLMKKVGLRKPSNVEEDFFDNIEKEIKYILDNIDIEKQKILEVKRLMNLKAEKGIGLLKEMID